jgi:hypothetical protein
MGVIKDEHFAHSLRVPAKKSRKLVLTPVFDSYLERGDRTGAFGALTCLTLAIN